MRTVAATPAAISSGNEGSMSVEAASGPARTTAAGRTHEGSPPEPSGGAKRADSIPVLWFVIDSGWPAHENKGFGWRFGRR